jgi:hypothetical protein
VVVTLRLPLQSIHGAAVVRSVAIVLRGEYRR